MQIPTHNIANLQISHFIEGTCASWEFSIRRGPGTNPLQIQMDGCIALFISIYVPIHM